MTWLKKLSRGLRSLFQRAQSERELDDELRFHLDRLTAENVEAGMSPKEARRRARIELGGVEQVKERVHEVRWGTMLETFWQDMRYGVRMLRRNPGFTTVAVLTLALGIGANTAIFSVVNAVLLRPLPYDNPHQLVMVWETIREAGYQTGPSYPNFEDWREQNQVFEQMVAFRSLDYTLTGVEEAVRVQGARVSAGFFPLLRVEPILGRPFLPEEDQAGAKNVVILSYGFWHRRFGGDPGAVGKKVTLDGTDFTVIGVLPPGFKFPYEMVPAELWTPTALDAELFPQRGLHALGAIGRLKPGVTLQQAQAEMDTIARRLEQEYPEDNTGRGVNLVPLHRQVVGGVRPALLILLSAVGFVLLIACANTANLLLARGAARQEEMSIRAALGAGRGRLVGQWLTESMLLGLAGGTAGLVLALWALDAFVALVPDDFPRLGSIGIDGRVAGFALTVSLLTGLASGLAPAIHASGPDLQGGLKASGRTSAGSGRHRLRSLLVVSEVMLTLVLLIGAGLLIRSFLRLLDVKPGFNPMNILTFEMSAPPSDYDGNQLADFYRQVLDRVKSLPGVVSAGSATTLPLTGNNIGTIFRALGRPAPAPGEEPRIMYYSISPGYFRTMQIPLLKGRVLTERDMRDKAGVIVVNETLARRFWPGQDPLGEQLSLGLSLDQEGEPEAYEIVGIVGDVRHRGLDREVFPQIYVSYRQQTWAFMSFVVRSNRDPLSLVGGIRNQTLAVEKNQPVYNFQTMEQYLLDSVGQRRFSMMLVGLFALVALLLATMGVYSVVSYSVTQRTHEIGIRLALGAKRGDIFRLILGQGLGLTLMGVGVGLGGAFALTRFLESLLFGVATTDPLIFTAVPAFLLAVALLACYIPARRAMKVDPMVALRYE